MRENHSLVTATATQLKRVLIVFALLVIGPSLPTAGGRPSSGIPAPKPAGALFQAFNCVVYTPPAGLGSRLGIGWVREPFYWDRIEPKKGTWQWANTDQIVATAHSQGIEVLPLLAYTATWAASAAGNSKSPPGRVADWEDYVDHVVSRYSAPPFNLRYFQIWNEPTRQAGFWTGTDQEFVDKVYLPAAKIIRRYHCFVVFGGWPASNSLQEFDSVLEYHDAWRWTDILDVHYEGLSYWQYLDDHWVKSGKCEGIWETELGFTSDPDFIPSTYLPMLYWSLKTGWSGPNAYKLFWYAAWGAGPDGAKCLTETDAKGQVVLSDQGKRLAVLNQLLGAGSLGTFDEYQIAPASLRASTMGFTSGSRIVIAMLVGEDSARKPRNVAIRVAVARKPVKVRLIDEDGAPLKDAARFRRRYLTVKASLQPLTRGSGRLAIAYLEIDPSRSKN